MAWQPLYSYPILHSHGNQTGKVLSLSHGHLSFLLADFSYLICTSFPSQQTCQPLPSLPCICLVLFQTSRPLMVNFNLPPSIRYISIHHLAFTETGSVTPAYISNAQQSAAFFAGSISDGHGYFFPINFSQQLSSLHDQLAILIPIPTTSTAPHLKWASSFEFLVCFDNDLGQLFKWPSLNTTSLQR